MISYPVKPSHDNDKGYCCNCWSYPCRPPNNRNNIIEECARIALEWPRQEMGIAVSIAIAIRALKDKQP